MTTAIERSQARSRAARFAIDRPSIDQSDLLKRRGDSPDAKLRLVAVDLRNGKELWGRTDGVFGSWLSYSDEYGILVEAGRNARASTCGASTS